jgi:hypothetical protein
VTRLALAYLHDVKMDYTRINAAVGALECAKLELYRRVATPYERGKEVANGDVYDGPVIVNYVSEVIDSDIPF